jgi:mono/diheme cytochrome c family protein
MVNKIIGPAIVVLTLTLSAAQQPPAVQGQPQAPASAGGEYVEREGPGTGAGNFVVPLRPLASLSPELVPGRKLFVQRCSVCHLPGLPIYNAYGPLLDGKYVTARGDKAMTAAIANGSRRMPGFKYTLQPREIQEILAYLKTVELSKTP